MAARFCAPNDSDFIGNISLDNNDLLRRLRYALSCDDAQTAKLIQLGGGQATAAKAASWRVKDTDPQFAPCSAATISSFLDGLILEKRGPKEEKAPSPWPSRTKNKQTAPAAADAGGSESGRAQPEQMDNNVVLKQLRIALSLRSNNVHEILKAGGSAMSESEASALFRKPDARNYRQCGDQVLRQFIAGLVEQRKKTDKD